MAVIHRDDAREPSANGCPVRLPIEDTQDANHRKAPGRKARAEA